MNDAMKRLPFIVPTTVHSIKAAEPCEYERDCTLVYDCELVGGLLQDLCDALCDANNWFCHPGNLYTPVPILWNAFLQLLFELLAMHALVSVLTAWLLLFHVWVGED
ncbi:hypothetical protein QUC31_013865 [Theobroma cacao]